MDFPILNKQMIERESKGFKCLVADRWFQFTLPYSDRMPAHRSKFLLYCRVTLFVASYLGLPEVNIRFWHDKIAAAFVTVPETTIDEDTGTVLAQHHIGFARKQRMVQTVSEAVVPKIPADYHFGFRILALNSCHVVVALYRVVNVRHERIVKNNNCKIRLIRKTMMAGQYRLAIIDENIMLRSYRS